MKLTAQISVLLIIFAAGSGHARTLPEEFVPGDDPRDVVGMYGLSFQAAAVPSDPGQIQFHIVINGGRTDGKPIEQSLRLARIAGGTAPSAPTFTPYPGAPNIKTSRNGTMVTVDFTAPKKVADDANLALYFKACFTECDEFYALLAKFVVMPSTPAGTSFRNGPVSGAWNRVFPPAGFCCNDATLFVFTPGGSPRDDEERFAASLVSLQVATTDLKDGRAQFQIVIEGRPGAGADVRWIEQTLRLTWLVNTSIGSEFSEFEPSAGGVSKIAVSRKDATITVDFTAPKEMIDDPRLALSFIPGYFGAGIDPDGGLFQFYASPAAFRSGEAPARTKD